MATYKVTYQSIEDLSIKNVQVEADNESTARGTALLQYGWDILSTLKVKRINL